MNTKLSRESKQYFAYKKSFVCLHSNWLRKHTVHMLYLCTFNWFVICCLLLFTPSVAPRVVARSPSVHEDGESPPIPMVTLDHALPVTSLQIWLADGRRLVQRFNLSHRWVSQSPKGQNSSDADIIKLYLSILHKEYLDTFHPYYTAL